MGMDATPRRSSTICPAISSDHNADPRHSAAEPPYKIELIWSIACTCLYHPGF
jgi:hypothetical protein